MSTDREWLEEFLSKYETGHADEIHWMTGEDITRLRTIAATLPPPYSPQPPTEPGWYWCRNPQYPNMEPRCYVVYRTEYGMAAASVNDVLALNEHCRREWSGPIPQPK